MPERNLNFAMDKDEVLVELGLNSKMNDKLKGSIVKILKRNTTEIIGTFEVFNEVNGWVTPNDTLFLHDVLIEGEKNCNKAANGQVVRVEILTYPSKNKKPTGKIVEIIGN